MIEDILKLEPTPHSDKWILWQIEDRVAQRRSHVLCAPSIAIAQRQFTEVKEKQKCLPGDLYLNILGAYDKGELYVIGEIYE